MDKAFDFLFFSSQEKMNLVWELTFLLMAMPERRGKKRGSFFFPWESKRQRRKILSASSARGRALEKNIWFAKPNICSCQVGGREGAPTGKEYLA